MSCWPSTAGILKMLCEKKNSIWDKVTSCANFATEADSTVAKLATLFRNYCSISIDLASPCRCPCGCFGCLVAELHDGILSVLHRTDAWRDGAARAPSSASLSERSVWADVVGGGGSIYSFHRAGCYAADD